MEMPKKEVIQTFINSFVNPDFLGLALGENPDLNVLIFLPKIDGITFDWVRRDKIPITSIDWTPNLLNNYADFVLDNLRKESNGYCKKLPTFKELMSNQWSADRILKKLRHPRDLHIFMTNLIKILNQNFLILI